MLALVMPNTVTWPRLVARHKGMPLYDLVPVLLYSSRELERLPPPRSLTGGVKRFPRESKVRLLCFPAHIVGEESEE